MKKTSGFIGFGILFLVIGLCVGFSFLFQNQEKRYSEILVSVNPGSMAKMTDLTRIADEHGFKLEEQPFAFKAKNSFTEKHKIFKISKYNLEPEELNTVIGKFARLQAEGVIEAVEPNYRVKLFSNDPLYDKQWNLKQMNIEDVWIKGTGKEVVVAVVDTGVSKKLGDLSSSRFVKGYNFVDRNEDFEDENGHGSHVAGTIGQDTNNGKGVAGIAYDCKIMPLKVLGPNGYGSTMNIAEAIVYAAENGANVINMSLGGGGFSEVLKDACDFAYEKNVIVVAAAGNESRGNSSFPGRYDTVISVAASGPAFDLAGYSNYGIGVDLVAPGGDTRSALHDGVLQNAPAFLADKIDGYEKAGDDYFYYFQGTSMASPHVAGLSAILYQLGVRTPDRMRQLLVSSSTRSITEMPLIDPVNAVNNISKNVKVPEKGRVEPTEPNYNTGAVTTSFLTSLFTVLIGIALLFVFDKTRKKTGTIENIHKLPTYLGVILGASGLSLVGTFLQNIFPFSILPERFAGILFNSVLDYDRVIFLLNQPTMFWHNLLIPAFFAVLLNFKDQGKRRFSVGMLVGFSAKLIGDGLFVREMLIVPDGFWAILFLVVNGLLAFTLPYIVVKES
ncbi:MAG: S8 family serine peptidase [Spirochaetales bacterium]|nr:S8 family serine peptidase [Spirochaetales bacterium]